MYLSMDLLGIARAQPLGLEVKVAEVKEVFIEQVLGLLLSPLVLILLLMGQHHHIPPALCTHPHHVNTTLCWSRGAAGGCGSTLHGP